MRDDDRQNNIARYRQRYHQFGYSPKTLGWSKGSQRVRFAAAIEGLGLDFASVIDVGCGFGDLFAFLKEQGWSGSYLGIDLVPELLAEGERRFGSMGANFTQLEISSEQISRADLVVALGIFNHHLGLGQLDFIRQTVGAMYEKSSQIVVADFLSATADKPREDLFYASSGQMLEVGLSMSRRAMIHHAYMPFEFQLKIWRDAEFTSEAPVFRPYRKFLGPQ